MSLVSISVLGLSQKNTFSHDETVKGHVPPTLCLQAPALGGERLIRDSLSYRWYKPWGNQKTHCSAKGCQDVGLAFHFSCLSLSGQRSGEDWDALRPAPFFGQPLVLVLICGRELGWEPHLAVFQLPCQKYCFSNVVTAQGVPKMLTSSIDSCLF